MRRLRIALSASAFVLSKSKFCQNFIESNLPKQGFLNHCGILLLDYHNIFFVHTFISNPILNAHYCNR